MRKEDGVHAHSHTHAHISPTHEQVGLLLLFIKYMPVSRWPCSKSYLRDTAGRIRLKLGAHIKLISWASETVLAH